MQTKDLILVKEKKDRSRYIHAIMLNQYLKITILFYNVFSSLSIALFTIFSIRDVALSFQSTRVVPLSKNERNEKCKQKYSRGFERGGGGGGGGKSCRAYIIKFSGGNADYWFDYRFDYIWLRPLAARARASVINQPSGSGKKRRKGTSVCRCCRSSRRISFRPLFFEKFFERINKERARKSRTRSEDGRSENYFCNGRVELGIFWKMRIFGGAFHKCCLKMILQTNRHC